MPELITTESIASKIYFIRGVKIMLDRDLAELYGVTTSALNKAVSRNIDRFPPDFMLQLNPEEFANLKSHFGTSSWGGTRKPPRAYTEQGVAMLSSVLRSKRAVQVNIEIMRTFTKIRHMISASDELKTEIEDLRKHTDDRFQIVFEALDQLLDPEKKSKKEIGFTVKEQVELYG
ncbi:MAG: ORF6N domain-containing protein [Desulfobacteraceae bacterium]|nr:ORF6N domain-containing protein [Desulfobacteraceae bacterium]MBC2756595.1 ORF6N domain-containing protein [Desulfobacteraceae bacterium]